MKKAGCDWWYCPECGDAGPMSKRSPTDPEPSPEYIEKIRKIVIAVLQEEPVPLPQEES